jgi:DNA invertase Pin-like site-specific DNA recombinase
MIAAIYARKSTDQNRPDAEKSVTRQVEHATAYATGKGWTVGPAHIYGGSAQQMHVRRCAALSRLKHEFDPAGATTGEDRDGLAAQDSATCLKSPDCQEPGDRPSFRGT